MFIQSEILLSNGGVIKKFKKGEFIFHEGENCHCYHQILMGKIRMFNTNFDGKEFTQSDFTDGESFGEPPIFIDEVFPSTAVALENTSIIKISKDRFFEIINNNAEIQRKLITLFAKRIYSKAVTMREIVNNSPEARILSFLKSYKKKINSELNAIVIPYSRQEIANFTGLRVETVIRTIQKMKDKKRLQIINRKIVF